MTDEKSHLPPYSPGLKNVIGAQTALSSTPPQLVKLDRNGDPLGKADDE